jgi:NAD(P)H-dependent FMN reductase
MTMTVPKILAFAGSTRKDSFNKKLVQIAVSGARKAGAEVTYLDLRDFPMPLYDGDLETEHGLPIHAEELKNLMRSHQGLLISAPEYNSGISGVLKNTIDWMSRPLTKEVSFNCFDQKTAVLMSASVGGLGGLRGLVQVRSILENMGVLVLPQQVA